MTQSNITLKILQEMFKILGERVEELKAPVMFSLIFPAERYGLEGKRIVKVKEFVLQMVPMGKVWIL